MKRSVTSLPLHTGRAPTWLFEKMKRLSGALIELIVMEYGAKELLTRLTDPLWFQALGCVVGFDWHSSGLTTTLCGALKEGLATLDEDIPLAICGGKAKRAIKTPDDIRIYGERWGIDPARMIEMSRLCAKIDNTAIQDGYSLYHHTFIFTPDGSWGIIQQGMNGEKKDARRYQWLDRENLDIMSDPHTGITCDRTRDVLNFVAGESLEARDAVVDFSSHEPDKMGKTWQDVVLSMPKRHYISAEDVNTKRLIKTFTTLHEAEPRSFRDVIEIRGVGPRTMGALALVSELVYNAPPSFQDPARFSFAHGGKDGYPFPVDKPTYEHSIDFLKTCIDKAKLGDRDKIDAFRRMARL
ncbi:MAG: DUF763 domain-containing protein [Syntrophorhabdaceae bacterium]